MKRNFDTVRTEYGLGFPEKKHEHPTKATIRKHLPEKAIPVPDSKERSLRDMDYREMSANDMDVSAALVKMWYDGLQK